jgi:hypothetical protein
LIVLRVANNGLYKPDASVRISLSNMANLSDLLRLASNNLLGASGLDGCLFFPFQFTLYHNVIDSSSFLGKGLASFGGLECYIIGRSLNAGTGLGQNGWPNNLL